MRIYVAATFTRYEEVRALNDRLREAGHSITYDWTRTAAFGPDGHPLGDGYDLPEAVQARYAQEDLDAVARAEVLLALGEGDSLGWPVEVGAALAFGSCIVYLVAPRKPTVFWALPRVRVFDGVEEAMTRLGAPALEPDEFDREERQLLGLPSDREIAAWCGGVMTPDGVCLRVGGDSRQAGSREVWAHAGEWIVRRGRSFHVRRRAEAS